MGSEDMLPWANDGAGGGGTRNHYDNPGVGLLTSGPPSSSWIQSTHNKQSLPISSWLVEFHLARCVLKCNVLFATEMTLCPTKPQTSLVSNFFFPKCIFVESQYFFSPLHLHYEEETYNQKPETDEMNEVETAPGPEEKHIWVQPRVIKPVKPKKTSTVKYMSESGSLSALCHLASRL